VVHLAGEHPRELGGAQALLELRQAAADCVDHAVVLLGGAELEELLRVVDVARQLLDELDGLLDRRALAVDGLGLLRVVPEAGSERGLVQAIDLVAELRDVKDAPLAS
jgi:hypothetical protein